jgi:DNA primase
VTMSILNLLTADGITPIHTSRGEWHSPCPECGGVDRFSCCPEKVNSNGRFKGGRFVCRGCGIYGDAVAYLMKRRAMTFLQAVKQLGLDAGPRPDQTENRTRQPEPPRVAPPAAWQEKGKSFMNYCSEQLQRNTRAMTWLQTERGLNPESIRAPGLGWNSRNFYQDRAEWGLPPEISSRTGKAKRIWFPEGLIIPLIDSVGNITRLRIRQSEPGDGDRYILASGSDGKQAMCQWTDQRAVAVFESELDGLLVKQEAGELIGVVGLGSAAIKPDSELHWRLMKAERILCCLDSDNPGSKAAWGH